MTNVNKKEQIGNLEVRTQITDNFKSVKITPKGFWTDVMGLSQHPTYGTGDEPKWETPQLSRSSGGSDGTLNPAEEIDSVIEGLEYIKGVYNDWVKETENDEEI